jgi:Flp pilus assembly protein TadG
MNAQLARSQRGQVIVILTVAMVALLAMVALIIDGGTAFAQQRAAQNGADSASEAGAVVLLQALAKVSPTKTGSDVDTAVQTTAAANGLATPVQACYTDINGEPLNTDGTSNSNCASAAQVGPGLPIPPCSACPGGSASGVRVAGGRSFNTFFAGVIGISGFTASATATAISGYVTGTSGPVVPVTYPVFATACDGTNHAIAGSTTPWPVGPANVLTIPLCQDSAGNVGWIDWDPGDGGGANELADAILGTPPNPAITTPRWYDITATGNINSGQVQTAMEHWIGTTIILPIFSNTCDDEPLNANTNTIGLLDDCVAGGGSLGGHGSNNWYFLVGFAAFHLNEVWIQGSHSAECNAYPVFLSGGNGGTSCLIGYFTGPEEAVSLGSSVGAGGGTVPNTAVVGVQLIR